MASLLFSFSLSQVKVAQMRLKDLPVPVGLSKTATFLLSIASKRAVIRSSWIEYGVGYGKEKAAPVLAGVGRRADESVAASPLKGRGSALDAAILATTLEA
jgi:hypothetical protein